MDEKGKVTNFSYLLLIASIPFIFFILAIITSFISNGTAVLFFFLSLGSLFLIVIGFFIMAIFFGKRINSLRRKSWNPLSNQNYFFDIINEAVSNGWKVKEIGKEKVTISGRLNSQLFELTAEFSSIPNKGKRSTREDIAILFPIPKKENFYLTQGNLPGLLGEKIIKEFSLKGVTAIGEKSIETANFLNQYKTIIKELFSRDFCLSELHFEDGQMDAVVLNDYDDSGRTRIKEIIENLSLLAEGYQNYSSNQGSKSSKD